MAAKKNGKNKRESFGVTLSGRGLAAVIVLFVVGLVWTFVLGVLVGRGYKPEETVPRLAELMPEPAKNATETAGGKGPGVLRPEELEFFDELQKKPEVTAEKTKPEAPEPPEKAETEPPEQTGEPRTDARDDEVYMYLYQTAAFRKADQARDFRARIESLGYSAGIETVTYGGNTWHRVLVNFKGAPEDTRSLKKALKGLGVEKPLLRGKKPL
jgi:cell division septation protein DedD